MTVNWTNASTNGSAAVAKDIEDAAGRVTVSIDRLVDDPSISPKAIVGVLDSVADLIDDRTRLQGFLTGQPAQTASAIGASTPAQPQTPAPAGGLTAADQRVIDFEKLVGDIAGHFQVQLTLSGGKIDTGSALKAITDKITADVAAAKAAPTGSITKSAAQAELDKVKKVVADVPLGIGHSKKTEIEPIEDAIQEFEKLLA